MASSTEEPLTGEAAAFAAATGDIPDTLGGEPLQDGSISAEAPPPVVGGLTQGALETVFGMGFGALAAMRGEGGKFWELQQEEKSNLAEAWLPVIGPLWAKWIGETDGAIVAAVLCTAVKLGPRLIQDTALRASRTASTETAKFGDSSSSPGRPAAANPPKQTVSLDTLAV
jgi:hypothetical protein